MPHARSAWNSLRSKPAVGRSPMSVGKQCADGVFSGLQDCFRRSGRSDEHAANKDQGQPAWNKPRNCRHIRRQEGPLARKAHATLHGKKRLGRRE